MVPQYQRRVLFDLGNVSTTDPTVNYNDLLLVEGKTAGYTVARFQSARIIGVSVFGKTTGTGVSGNIDGGVGLQLREGEPATAFVPIGMDVGGGGVARANVRVGAGAFLSQKWQSGSDAFMRVTDAAGVPLSSASNNFFGYTIEVTAAFR